VGLLGFAISVNAIAPLEKRVDLVGEIAAGRMAMFSDSVANLPESTRGDWSVQPDGQLKVASKVYGQMRSNEGYGDFHLVLEYNGRTRQPVPARQKRGRLQWSLMSAQRSLRLELRFFWERGDSETLASLERRKILARTTRRSLRANFAQTLREKNFGNQENPGSGSRTDLSIG
jgi:hypothetical protein